MLRFVNDGGKVEAGVSLLGLHKTSGLNIGQQNFKNNNQWFSQNIKSYFWPINFRKPDQYMAKLACKPFLTFLKSTKAILIWESSIYIIFFYSDLIITIKNGAGLICWWTHKLFTPIDFLTTYLISNGNISTTVKSSWWLVPDLFCRGYSNYNSCWESLENNPKTECSHYLLQQYENAVFPKLLLSLHNSSQVLN